MALVRAAMVVLVSAAMEVLVRAAIMAVVRASMVVVVRATMVVVVRRMAARAQEVMERIEAMRGTRRALALTPKLAAAAATKGLARTPMAVMPIGRRSKSGARSGARAETRTGRIQSGGRRSKRNSKMRHTRAR